MSDSVYETECAQVDALIAIKQNEIAQLEALKEQWTEDWDETPTTQTPAQVAADPDASSAERATAANNTTNQSPEQVNAEQSAPSPSTHDSAKESKTDEGDKKDETEADAEVKPEEDAKSADDKKASTKKADSKDK